MALPSVSNTFTGGTSAIAAQVNQNFTDLVNAMTDGTKSFSIDALTLATNLIVGGTVSMAGQFLIKNGAVGSPGLTSSGFLTSGIYFAAGPTFGVTIAGTSILEIGSGSSTFRNNLNIFAGGSGAIATITGYNSSNTASSGVVFDAVLAGTAATGNAIFRSTVTGSSGRQWSWGGDQGNSGRFSIAQNSNLGSNDFFIITITGRLGLAGTTSTEAVLDIADGFNPLTGTNQIGINMPMTSSSAATGSTIGYLGQVTTAAAVYASAYRAHFESRNTAKGAGSTITRDIAYLAAMPTQGGTGNAILSDTTTINGNYGLYLTTTNPSQFSGLVGHKQATDNVTDALPTQAEMVTALGAANQGTGMMGFLKDANADTNFFICVSNGTSWYALKMTKGA